MSVKEIMGGLNGVGQKHCIIVSRFNDFITESLLRGALESFQLHGVETENITIIKAPGAFEIPTIVAKILIGQKFDSILCIGAIIRGSTPHFDYVASQVSKVGDLSIQHKTPVIFSILTTDNLEQAIERSGVKMGNKGYEGASTAIEMVNLMKKI